MKTILLTIGFTLGGILTSLVQAQSIPLTIDSNQSSVEFTFGNSSSTSQLSGNATIDLQFSKPPSGNAQITDLNLVLDDTISVNVLFTSVSTTPGDVTISLVTPGASGAISGTSFDQLGNLFELSGAINAQALFGGNQTTDLSTIDIGTIDLNSVEVTQSQVGETNNFRVSNSFTIDATVDFGPLLAQPIQIDVTIVANGTEPVCILGDVNGDGVVDFNDIPPFVTVVLGNMFQCEADCDENCLVDFNDIPNFVDILLNP